MQSAERRVKTDARGSLASFCTLHSELCTTLLAVAAFAALSATMAVRSDGFLEGDACTHYLYARYAWSAPAYLANVWGRPICTGLYAIPAHFGGRTGARLTSLAAAVVMALVTASIARRQGWRWPALAVVFTFAQPLVFLHSFSELTELPFALLMACAFLAYQRRQWFWLALTVGLMPLSRPEGFGFVAMVAGALLLHRRARWWPVLAAPLFAWDLAGWWLYGRRGPWWHWLIANWPYAGDSLYDRGYLLKFVALLPAVVGPFVFPATLIGVLLCLGGRRRAEPSAFRALLTDHARRCEFLIAALPLSVLVGHSLLTWTGKMASNGEVRYMLVVAPFWSLLAARGWGWTFDRLALPHPRLWASAAAVAALAFNRVYGVIPQHPSDDWVEAYQIADWYAHGTVSHRYPRLALAHPGLKFKLDFPPGSDRTVDWTRATLATPTPGTLLVWDYVDGLYNADASRSVPVDFLQRAGWVEFPTAYTGGAGRWRFFVAPTALRE